MSEPAKQGSSADPLEADRARARQLAVQNARRRIVRRPVTPAPKPAAAQPAAEQTAEAEQAAAEAAVQQDPDQPPLTRAQQQALAYRAAAERRYGQLVPHRTIHRANAQTAQAAPAEQAEQAARPAQATPQQPAQTAAAPQTARKAHAAPETAEAAEAARPDKQVYRAPKGEKAARKKQPDAAHGKKPAPETDPKGKKGKGKKGGKADGTPYSDTGKKKKKRLRWWQILLLTLLIIALILGAAVAYIFFALRPNGSANATGVTIDSIINTPKEYQGQYLNVLLVGVDRSSTDDLNAGAVTDSDVNDGMTDMLLWLHFDNVNGTVSMLQIPRDIMVTTDASYSSNYMINGIAKTNGTDGYNNINALATYINDHFKLPVDGYVSIRLESLVELVDILGGVDVYVPEAIDYSTVTGGGDSYLPAGMQRLTGTQVEFFLRARETYNTGDLQRLEVQRYFYAALFARLKSMSVLDIARMVPFALSYCETDLSMSDLVSVAVSLLSVHSDKITFARVPVYMGETLNYPNEKNNVLVVARQETADLLNQYFRDADDQVAAEDLDFCEVLDTSGIAPQDSALRVMNDINAEAADAKENNNLIDSGIAQTDVYEVISDSASDSTSDSASDSASDSTSESEPAA